MGWRSSFGIVLCTMLVAALPALGLDAAPAVPALPQTGGFVTLSTLLLIGGGVLLVVVGAIAYAVLSRRGARD